MEGCLSLRMNADCFGFIVLEGFGGKGYVSFRVGGLGFIGAGDLLDS